MSPQALLDPAYLAERAALIDLAQRERRRTPACPKTGGTVYLASADADGTMVS